MGKQDTWSATNAYYANATTQPFRAIAYFSDRRWATGFTYSLRMYSDLQGTGNHKVGMVFNYVDEETITGSAMSGSVSTGSSR
jgi:hypothetical protein